MSRPPSFSDLVGNLDYAIPDVTLAPSPSSSFLTLRRLTKSPASTIRSGFRRSRTSVSSIASSSTASLPSLSGLSQQANRFPQDDLRQQAQQNQQQSPASCASRQQLGANDCALSRFIAWVAVRRNVSQDLSPDEKRRCPLIKCRKIFPSPELMLQHLIACDKLDEGLYYCHDCKRNELFADTRCTRCIGHPSRRRKIAKMAKSFFSSLGQRPKVDGPPELDLLADDMSGPYEMEQTQSIHEIGTSDILAPILEEDKELESLLDSQYMHQPSSVTVNSCTWGLQEEERDPCNLQGLNRAFSYHRAMDPIHESTEQVSVGKPRLQVKTSGPGFTRLHSAKRQRVDALMHQSSTRSTASTNSTASNTSTVSSMSTASHEISPLSAVSGAWARKYDGHGYETDATTPADEGINLDDFFPPVESGCSSAHPGSFVDCMEDVVPGRSELPADQPDINGLDWASFAVETQTFGAAPVSVSVPQLSHCSVDDAQFASVHSVDNLIPEVNLPELEANPVMLGSPTTLVETVKTALDEHIEQSREKLRGICGNHLIDKFVPKSPSDIAHAALKALSEVLSNRRPADPVDLLCFIHLIYSFSLVLREQDAPSQWKHLFSGVLSYSSSLSKQDFQAYVHIVALLWKPEGMTGTELKEMLITTSSRSESSKGKAPQRYNNQVSDALAFVAQYFLDELDYLALHDSSNTTVMLSDIATQHLQDDNVQGNVLSSFQQSANHLLQLLTIHYSEPTFIHLLTGLSFSSGTRLSSTPRRLELDLLRAGRTCLAPAVFFDEYIHLIRGFVDKLYEEHAHNPRSAYHLNALRLMENLLIDPAKWGPKSSSKPEEVDSDSIDAIIANMTPSYGEGSTSFPTSSYGTSSKMALLETSVIPHSGSALANDLAGLGLVPEVIGTSGPSPVDQTPVTSRYTTASTSPTHVTPSTHETPPSATTAPTPSSQQAKVISDTQCKYCDYRPEGDPRWFHGSMSKHIRTKHQSPKIFKCPFPGCKSQYTNREDNLKQHQAEKNHYVGDEKEMMMMKKKKSSKRKREIKENEEEAEEE